MLRAAFLDRLTRALGKDTETATLARPDLSLQITKTVTPFT